MRVIIIKEITYNIFENIIVTALEGGSNYWYLINDKIGQPKGTSPSTYIADKLWNDKEYRLDIYDINDEDELLGVITNKTCQKAFNIMADRYPKHLDNILDENIDNDDADIFFQLAVMGEVTFG